MNSIGPPDSHHLSAAVGWLGLGDWREAVSELEKIALPLRRHPQVLMVRWGIFSKAAQWDLADEVARELIEHHPQEEQFWIWHAYAMRRMPCGGISKAKEILSNARRLFPKDPLIAYNLGCYECQLKNLPAAWTWLEIAFDYGDPLEFKKLALQDEDLEPLWPKIRQFKPIVSP